MADEQNPTNGNGEDAAAAGATEGQDRNFNVRKLYLKDVSYESPSAPGVFAADSKLEPKIQMQLNTESRKLTDTLYEVVLVITVTAADPEQDRTAFLVEVKQAGLFDVKGFDDRQLTHLVGSYCPGILFPFAREVVAGLVQKGGMPPLLLQPINFDALLAQQQAQQADSDASSGPDATSAEAEQ